MKTVKFVVNCVLTVFLTILVFVSCETDSTVNVSNDTSLEVKTSVVSELYDDITFDAIASMHSRALGCAEEIILEKNLNPSELSIEQMADVTETAVLAAVEEYVAKAEGRSLTATEKNTLKSETDNFWNDTNHIKTFDNIANYSSVIPDTGTPDLNQLYQDFSISVAARKYYNKIFSSIDKSNYKNILSGLSTEVRGSTLPPKDKTALLEVIAVMKDSYDYWDKPDFGGPNTRAMNLYTKMCLKSDACGALKGVWRGLRSASTGLVFGPGGTVLTITGCIVVNAAISSIRTGVRLALIG